MTSLAGSGDRPLPGLATVAIEQARHVAKAIRNGQPGASTRFRFFDNGALAVVGGEAVCEVRGVELCGRPAFATYLGVHLSHLGVHLSHLGGGVGRRAGLLTDWVSTRIGHPCHQVIEGEVAGVERAAEGVEATAR